MAQPAMSVKVTVTGAREVIQALGQLEPELRKETVKQIRGAVRTITNQAKKNLPSRPPMSGWQTQPSVGGRGTNKHRVSNVPMVRGGRGWMPWDNPRRLVKSQIGRQRKQVRRKEWNVARVVSFHPAAVVYEFAGKGAGSSSPTRFQFIANIDRGGRSPGRVVWSAMDANEGQARDAILQALRNAEATINKKVNG